MNKILVKLNILPFLILFALVQPLIAQEEGCFPLDPYTILKTWTYEDVSKELGPGEQIIDTVRKQAYLAGYRYTREWFGRQGSLEFYFSPNGISRIQFSINYPVRELATDLQEQIKRDTLIRNAYNTEVLIQDSIRRDSVIQAISLVLGQPFSSGPTPAADKASKFAASWFTGGYVCSLRDLGTTTVVVFALAGTPDWAVREFDLPEQGMLISKEKIKQKRLAWTASLVAVPAPENKTSYERIFLLLEFESGQRFAEGLPALSHEALLPKIYFDDLTGDAVYEAWITVPLNLENRTERHYFYSLQFKDPQIIFNTDYSLPSEIVFQKGYNLDIVFPDGTILQQTLPKQGKIASFYLSDGNLKTPVTLHPDGFSSLLESERLRNGSLNLAGLIALPMAGKESAGFVSITYQYNNGEWEPISSEYTN